MRIPSEGPVLVSACLAGVRCTHDADASTRPWAVRLTAEGRAVLVCPEVAGGLGIPRPAAEIQGGDGHDVLDGRARVRTAGDEDVTAAYIAGAEKALAAARASGAAGAILKARSPSCGSGLVYDGAFRGVTAPGDGVAAAALRRAGVWVCTDEDVEE